MFRYLQVLRYCYYWTFVGENLKSFSISALNRYSSIIQTSFDENILFGEKLSRVVVYYTPHFIELITTMFYKSIQVFITRVEYISKEKSEEQLRILLK